MCGGVAVGDGVDVWAGGGCGLVICEAENQWWLLGREELPWRARQRLFVSLCVRACVLA